MQKKLEIYFLKAVKIKNQIGFHTWKEMTI